MCQIFNTLFQATLENSNKSGPTTKAQGSTNSILRMAKKFEKEEVDKLFIED